MILPLGIYLKETRGQSIEGMNSFNAHFLTTVKDSNILEGSLIDKYLVFRSCLHVRPLASTGPYSANAHLVSNKHPKPWEKGQFWMPIKSSKYSFLDVTISLGVMYISGSLEKHGKEAVPEYKSMHYRHRKTWGVDLPMVAHACNPHTQEAETKNNGVKTSLDYISGVFL